MELTRFKHPRVKTFEENLPIGFVDDSYGNDVCASVISSALGLKIFIDSKNPEDREEPQYPRFSIYKTNIYGETEDLIFETDEFEKIKDIVNKY